ncbi:MAG: SAF domain-containing protein [Natronosporangium sp.]
MTRHAGQAVPRVAGGPVPALRRLRQRRLRPAHVAAAVAVVIVGAVGGAVAVSAAAAGGQYLAVARDVSYGAELSGEDLATVRIDTPPGVMPVPAADRDQVVGLYAAMPLVRGSLLVAGMLTAEPIPAGQHVVGIALDDDRLPGQRPGAGETVLLVSTGSGSEGSVAASWRATVMRVSTAEEGLLGSGGSQVTLDVAVPPTAAPQVARAAAAGELVVVRTGQGG